MDLPFTHKPGRRERYLRRRHGSPLFAWPPEEVSPEDLLEAQRLDHEAMVAFRERLGTLVRRAADLPASADSDTVLALKQDLERAYEDSYGLPEDHERERAALSRLTALTTRAVLRAAGSDPLALKELQDELDAREIHFRLLEHPLVGDILDPESPIAPEDLPACLLSAGAEEAEAALGLFDGAQLADLAERAAVLLDGLVAQGLDLPGPRARLELLRERIRERAALGPDRPH